MDCHGGDDTVGDFPCTLAGRGGDLRRSADGRPAALLGWSYAVRACGLHDRRARSSKGDAAPMSPHRRSSASEEGDQKLARADRHQMPSLIATHELTTSPIGFPRLSARKSSDRWINDCADVARDRTWPTWGIPGGDGERGGRDPPSRNGHEGRRGIKSTGRFSGRCDEVHSASLAVSQRRCLKGRISDGHFPAVCLVLYAN